MKPVDGGTRILVQLAIYLWRVRGLRVPTSAATDHVMLAASAHPQQVVHSGIFFLCLQSSCCCTIPSLSPCIQVHLDQYNVKRMVFAFPFCSDASSTTNICGVCCSLPLTPTWRSNVQRLAGTTNHPMFSTEPALQVEVNVR